MAENEALSYSVSFIAKLLLVSERRVQQLAAEGVIQKAERGGYALAPSVQGYIKFLQERSLRSDQAPIDYHAEKARLTKAQADKAEIESAQMSGDVVNLEQVERSLSNLFAEIRTSIRNIPDRVVSSLIGMTNEREFKNILTQEIDLALNALSESAVLVEPTDDDEALVEDGKV